MENDERRKHIVPILSNILPKRLIVQSAENEVKPFVGVGARDERNVIEVSGFSNFPRIFRHKRIACVVVNFRFEDDRKSLDNIEHTI